MNNLAMAYQAAGRLDEALPLLEETLRLPEGEAGPRPPDTIGSMDNLANIYHGAGPARRGHARSTRKRSSSARRSWAPTTPTRFSP